MVEPQKPQVAVTAVAPALPKRRGGAIWVSAGMLLSRVMGFMRVLVFARYLGTSLPAGAFNAALRIPNFLQNLFGEGVLSASFIPVYASLVGKEEREEADRVAGAVFGLLSLVTAILVAAGMVATPLFVDLIADFKDPSARDLSIQLVRILFPGTGILVLSAWCLGILNSHRRFFLSYAAPVLWNLAIIAALFLFGRDFADYALAERVAWGLVVGSALQFGVQVPLALRLVGGLRPELGLHLDATRTVLRNFLPVVVARGVVQVSAYIDNLLASLLPTGAVSALAYAQTLYLLPISLFGMSVSAAQLPAMASATGSQEEIAAALRDQLARGLRQIAFFIVPSVAGFLFVGDSVVAALFQTGAFDDESTRYVWAVLAGSTVGLLAVTQGRLYASAFYALHDTRTPLKYAAIRVSLTIALGWMCALWLPGWLGLAPKWGAVGLTASAGVAGWLEFLLLRGALHRRIGTTGLPYSFLVRLWAGALPAAGVGVGVKLLIGAALHPILRGGLVIGAFGAIYGAITLALGLEEATRVVGAVRRRLRR